MTEILPTVTVQLEPELDDLDDTSEEKGTFTVSFILPEKVEEELKPDKADTDSEGEEETPAEIEGEKCTYQLEPTVSVKPLRIISVAKRILKKHLCDKEYDALEIKDSVSKISSDIREKVKSMGLDRYRIVCQVTVGEKCNQDVAMTFLCLWKHETDHYAVATYDSESIFATAIIFVVYKQ